MSGRIFTEDEVVLREDPSISALVEQTWQDPDFTILANAELIPHRGVSTEAVAACIDNRALTRGLVIIKFVNPPVGLAIIHEADVVLKDRGLCVGDIVKRQGSFAESGYVVKTSLECDCRPVYPSMLYGGVGSWPHKQENNEVKVASEDLELLGFAQGRIVIYKGWIGEVMDMLEEVTVRMADGSVVRISTIDDLDTYVLERRSNTDAADHSMGLAESVRALHKAWQDHPEPMTRRPPENVFPGQLVYAKKSVFRLGSWIIGSYTPSIPAQGHILEVHTTSIEVDWLTCNVFAGSVDEQPPRPEAVIEGHELTEILLYNRNNLTELTNTGRNYGARQSQDIVIGDPVAFRDVAGAAVKYASSGINRNAGGGFRRVPRDLTNGFDINTLEVIGTKQYAIVQWQDGSTTNEESTNLLPDLMVDDHDYFVGELCSLRSAEATADGVVTLKKVGVIQSMNGRERTVQVRWHANSKIMFLEDEPAEMLPESALGELQDEISELSVYEVTSYEGLTKRRGDLVLVLPDRPAAVEPPAPSTSPNDIRWFGEVVDLGTDGLVTVRLGALDKVEDIRVPATSVYTVLGMDDASLEDEVSIFDDDDDDYSTESDYDQSIIAEEITYEGEPPDDPGDDDSWMTDVSGEEEEGEGEAEAEEKATAAAPKPISTADEQHAQDRPADPDAMNGVETHGTASSESDPAAASANHAPTDTLDYSFAEFADKPAQFEVLDTPPPADHHFVDKPSTLSAALLRRIRKEHKMLAALPPGIWVRTWADALYLVRILIAGPRNTPYELAPFVLDVHFKDDYPATPPQVYFHSWTYGVGRVNPNLYQDGKVCLSILGTWPHDQRNEGWNREHSSLLQVLVSLMGLVLVEAPYYNEAGFEALVGTEETAFASQTYSQRAFCMAKGFVEHALRGGVAGLDGLVRWLYVAPAGPRLLRRSVLESRHVLERSGGAADEGGFEGSFAAKMLLSAGAQSLLRRHLEPLEKRLADLA